MRAFCGDTGVGCTGVVGLLRNGEGATVLLHADMDALPIQETTGLSYASHATGTDRFWQDTLIAHACGHDMHVAWLMGAACLLRPYRDRRLSAQSIGGEFGISCEFPKRAFMASRHR